MEMFYFLFFAILSINLPPLHTHPHTHTHSHTLDLICTDKMDNYFVIFSFMDVFEIETSFNAKKEKTHNQPEVIKNLLFLLQRVKLLLLLMNNLSEKQLIW